MAYARKAMGGRPRTAIGLVVLALLFGALWSNQSVTATHEPANKVSAAGSTLEVAGPGTDIVILSEKVKTSKPTDLILGVTLECAIVTNVTTTGNDDQSAFGQIKVWVEIDGVPVKVSADDTGDPGKVIFCNRAYRRATALFDDQDATITTFISTRTANAFNWMALDVGSATHEIVVKAELTETASNKGVAEAVIGKRTLIVEPVKSANDETVTQLG